MSKHTKGPWKQQSYRMYASQSAKAEYPIHAPKKGLIAKAFSENDARLIAAAPELLEALEAVKNWDVSNLALDIPLEVRQKMQAAIAKTTGEIT